MHRNKFALNKPEPAVKITRQDRDPVKFTAHMNDVSILTLDITEFQNINGLTIEERSRGITVNVNPAKQFDVCDSKFRSLIGKLNSEICGLTCKEMDQILKEFDNFLADNNIHSKFSGGRRLSSERQTPGNNMAF